LLKRLKFIRILERNQLIIKYTNKPKEYNNFNYFFRVRKSKKAKKRFDSTQYVVIKSGM